MSEQSASRDDSAQINGTGRTFLVVDDSRLHHQIYNLVFAKDPFKSDQVLHVLNGLEGFETFRDAGRIDAVLLDINMPVMNGLEFLERRTKEELKLDVPVVLVTSEEPDAAYMDHANGGAKAHLKKPFMPEDLCRVLLNAMGETAE